MRRAVTAAALLLLFAVTPAQGGGSDAVVARLEAALKYEKQAIFSIEHAGDPSYGGSWGFDLYQATGELDKAHAAMPGLAKGGTLTPTEAHNAQKDIDKAQSFDENARTEMKKKPPNTAGAIRDVRLAQSLKHQALAILTGPSSAAATTTTSSCSNGASAQSFTLGGVPVGCAASGQYPCTPTAPYYSYYNQEFTWKGHPVQLVVTGPHLTSATSLFNVTTNTTGQGGANVKLYDNNSGKTYFATSGKVKLKEDGGVDFVKVFMIAFGGKIELTGEMTCGTTK